MKKTAEKSKGAFTWKLGFQVSPASKWGGEMMRKVGVMGVMFGAVVLAVWGVMGATRERGESGATTRQKPRWTAVCNQSQSSWTNREQSSYDGEWGGGGV